MTTNHRIRTLFISIIILLLLISAGYIAFIKGLDLETFRGQIIAELQKSLKRPVSYKSVNLSFSRGPAVSFHGISVMEPDNSADFIKIDTLTFQLDFLPLFKKQLVVHGLVADKAVITIVRGSDGTINISDLLESSDSEAASVKINQLKLSGAEITFIDSYLDQKPLITKLADTDLFLNHLTRGSKGTFTLSTNLQGGGGGTVAISGKIKIAPKGSPLESSIVDAEISAQKLEAAHFWPYYRKYVPFKKLVGTFDAETEIKGRLKDFSSTGKISLQGVQFDYRPVFKQVLTAKAIQLKYNLALNESDLLFKTVEVAIDGADIKGSCAIRGYRGEDPRITAQASTSKLDFEKFKQFIPYGVIVKDTAEWLEQHLAGGIYQLDEGRLDGRISQIMHMEAGQNYNVLAIKARVEKGVVSYGPTVPTFNNVKGTLEIKGKDFLLHNMSGNFGTSPMTLEGKIADFAIDKPTSYPVKMVISPSKSELQWLLGRENGSKLSYTGNSTLSLAGDGFTSAYNLSGDWNLTPAAYSYADFVKKPAGIPSQIKFKGSISPKEAVLTSLHYTLAGLNVDLSAKYRFEPSKSVNLLINTNQFTLGSIVPMSPFLTSYQPAGRIQLTLGGTLAPAAEDFRWSGVVALSNASIRYSAKEKPVSELSGNISFDDDSFESSQLTAKIGNTALTGKAKINSLSPVAFKAAFTSARIDLADFGYKHTQKIPQITKVSGNISYKENSLTINSVTGNVNNSQLTVKGVISDIEQLKAKLAITAPYLDISDLILLGGITPIESKTSKPAPNPSLEATVKADKCTFSDINFDKLAASVTLANKTLTIQQLESNIAGGKFTAKGKIDSHSPATLYQADFKLANASADKITKFFSKPGAKREITGEITLEGSMTASGNSGDALKRSASGSLKVHSREGMLRQLSGLSKVFSILNVSQLFQFKLPDMVSDGMPYSKIEAVFTIKDGTVSTEDLFVTSNAMNMSMVGKHDFVNDDMNLIVGIKPLQTVDKVVSKIPIVGWILTGKNKAMFTTYFELKGKSSDPQVNPIPITSLSEGVFGIFKRTFQLPVKLFTDTGQVILGN